MTPDKTNVKLLCAVGETITPTGTDLGTGTPVAFLTTDGSSGPGLPPPFTIKAGSQKFSISVAYPNDEGGKYTLTLTSSTGDTQVYELVQVHNTHDGRRIEFHTTPSA